MTLKIYGTEPASVFSVFGDHENTATFALGWVLEQSPALLDLLIARLDLPARGEAPAVIQLQRFGEDRGFTDIEINVPRRLHVVIEAKRGWQLPSLEQLERYVPRLVAVGSGSRAILTVSAASRLYAQRLPERIHGIPLMHLAWSDVRQLVATAGLQTSSWGEKMWLRELDTHLGGYVTIQDPTDNHVYVVSLATRPIHEGENYTWVDVVARDRRYFHPFGGSGWPVVPPNYIGFRYHGQLQSVHHVDAFEVVNNLASINPHWPESEEDHFVYRLGPPMRSPQPVRTGKIFRAGRVWCAIDTLLSGAYATISDARDETVRRLGTQSSLL